MFEWFLMGMFVAFALGLALLAFEVWQLRVALEQVRRPYILKVKGILTQEKADSIKQHWNAIYQGNPRVVVMDDCSELREMPQRAG